MHLCPQVDTSEHVSQPYRFKLPPLSPATSPARVVFGLKSCVALACLPTIAKSLRFLWVPIRVHFTASSRRAPPFAPHRTSSAKDTECCTSASRIRIWKIKEMIVCACHSLHIHKSVAARASPTAADILMLLAHGLFMIGDHTQSLTPFIPFGYHNVPCCDLCPVLTFC